MPFSLFTTSIAVAGRPPKFKSFSAITLNRRDPSCAQMVCHQIMYMVDCFFSVFFFPPHFDRNSVRRKPRRQGGKQETGIIKILLPASGLWTLDSGLWAMPVLDPENSSVSTEGNRNQDCSGIYPFLICNMSLAERQVKGTQ